MRITKQQLKQIIKEELARLSENAPRPRPPVGSTEGVMGPSRRSADQLISRLKGEDPSGVQPEEVWNDGDFAELAEAYKVIKLAAEDVYGVSFDKQGRDQEIPGDGWDLAISIARRIRYG